MNRKSLLLLAAGAILMSTTLVLKHYLPVTDFWDGSLKGIAIGLMTVSLILTSRQNRKKST